MGAIDQMRCPLSPRRSKSDFVVNRSPVGPANDAEAL